MPPLLRRCCILSAFILGLFCILVLLVSIAAIRALMLEEIRSLVTFSKLPNTSIRHEEAELFKKIMAGALKIKTVSTSHGVYDTEELLVLHQYLLESFPRVYNSSFIDMEKVNNYSLLFEIKGSDPQLLPFMLTSHLDVVPAEPKEWSKPPFLGEVVMDPDTGEECIWGRGSLDDKIGVVGILSALESLLSVGWTPRRTFYVAFGHDEEVSGFDGAAHIGQLLAKRGVTLDFLLDEGMPIVDGLMGKLLPAPVAPIGVTEKGRANIKISVEAVGGHSSIPPKAQAAQKLSMALHNLYQSPQPSMFGSGPEMAMLRHLALKVSWPQKLFLANTWLFGPVISYMMSKGSETDALIRTTTAVTIINAGVKTNVVPASASAIVNHRIHPSQSLEDVLAHDVAAIGDSEVKVEVLDSAEPHPVSPYGPDAEPYQLIAGAINHIYPDVVTVPSVMIANTDTIHYLQLTSHIYRFIPAKLTKSNIQSIHGKNERISVPNFISAIQFYRLIIQAAERPEEVFRFQHSSRNDGEL